MSSIGKQRLTVHFLDGKLGSYVNHQDATILKCNDTAGSASFTKPTDNEMTIGQVIDHIATLTLSGKDSHDIADISTWKCYQDWWGAY